MTDKDHQPIEQRLSTNINRFLAEAGPDRHPHNAGVLLKAAADLLVELAGDRDAAWKLARAAAEGHDRLRERLEASEDKHHPSDSGWYDIANDLKAEIAMLKSVLAMAGAPKDGDLMAWASDVRNTALGQRREIEELVNQLRDYRVARTHELAEIQAATQALPDVLKPANRDTPYYLARSPIEVFMLLRERALALVNPPTGSPVSGA